MSAALVLDVIVDRDGEGALVVGWTLSGPPSDVEVAVGPTPEAVDHAHHVVVPAGTMVTRVDGLGPGRHYVSVSVTGHGSGVVASERRVPFEGVTNFRDLGGYRTAGGGRTRWGVVFRADALHRFTTEDLVLYERLGMRAVYDLRGDAERAASPDPVPSQPWTLLMRAPDAPPAPGAQDVSAADGVRRLRDIYFGILEHAAPTTGRLLTSLVEPHGLPAVFHCLGGKDRTGLVAALLLDLLGVARDEVLDDYELTSRYRTRDKQEGSYQSLLASGLGPEAAASVLGTPRQAMADALDELDGRYGGIDAYLTGPAGMAPDDLTALRDRLVVRGTPA